MDNPRYQGIKSEQIPKIDLANQAGSLRIIAGEYQGHVGPAKTFSAMNVWDLRLKKNARFTVPVKSGNTSSFFVLSGQIKVESQELVREAELAVLDPQGDSFTLEAVDDTKVLILTGESLNEPIVGYGPFVMNSEAEIKQAFIDFQSGKMGQIQHIQGSE